MANFVSKFICSHNIIWAIVLNVMKNSEGFKLLSPETLTTHKIKTFYIKNQLLDISETRYYQVSIYMLQLGYDF